MKSRQETRIESCDFQLEYYHSINWQTQWGAKPACCNYFHHVGRPFQL